VSTRNPPGLARLWLLTIPVVAAVGVAVAVYTAHSKQRAVAGAGDAWAAKHAVTALETVPLAKTLDGSAISAILIGGSDDTVVVGTAAGAVEFRDRDGVPHARAVVSVATIPIVAGALSADGSTWAAATLQDVYFGTTAGPAMKSVFHPIDPAFAGLISVSSIALNSDGSMLAVGEFGIQLIDVSTRRLVAKLEQPEPTPDDDGRGEYTRITISNDNSTLYATDGQRTEIWNLGSRAIASSIRGDCAWTTSGSSLSCGAAPRVELRDSHTGEIRRSFTASQRPDQYIVATAVTDRGQNVLVLLGDGEVIAWNAESGRVEMRKNSVNGHVINGYLQLGSDAARAIIGVQLEESPFIDGAQTYEYSTMVGYIGYAN
jgi:hypothetical protein